MFVHPIRKTNAIARVVGGPSVFRVQFSVWFVLLLFAGWMFYLARCVLGVFVIFPNVSLMAKKYKLSATTGGLTNKIKKCRKNAKLSPFNWKIKFYAAAAWNNAGEQFVGLAAPLPCRQAPRTAQVHIISKVKMHLKYFALAAAAAFRGFPGPLQVSCQAGRERGS